MGCLSKYMNTILIVSGVIILFLIMTVWAYMKDSGEVFVFSLVVCILTAIFGFGGICGGDTYKSEYLETSDFEFSKTSNLLTVQSSGIIRIFKDVENYNYIDKAKFVYIKQDKNAYGIVINKSIVLKK